MEGLLLATLIPVIRREKNIKQYDMAKDLNVSPSFLCKVEKGALKPTEKFKKACAKYLKVEVKNLFPINDINREDVYGIAKNNIWNIRRKKGLKQYNLAKLLGCSPSYLSKIEKGIQMPNKEFKTKCAKILQISVRELFPCQELIKSEV